MNVDTTKIPYTYAVSQSTLNIKYNVSDYRDAMHIRAEISDVVEPIIVGKMRYDALLNANFEMSEELKDLKHKNMLLGKANQDLLKCQHKNCFKVLRTEFYKCPDCGDAFTLADNETTKDNLAN